MDERIKKLAKLLVDYSVAIKKGENVLISAGYEARELVNEIYKLCLLRDAYPMIEIALPETSFIFYKYARDHQLRKFPKISYYKVRNVDAFINISTEYNTRELTSVDAKKLAIRTKVTKKIKDVILRKKWVIFDFPTNALAQEAEMSLTEYEDFVYSACLLNWQELSKNFEKLKRRLDNTDKVRIIGKETDISFSVKNRRAVIDDAKNNMPGGEVFTSVVENSVEGHIFYEYPAIYYGKEASGIYLEFNKGKVIKARAEKNQDLLLKMLNTDKGAKYLGEFGIGLNPKINKFTKNILFDEKIYGTVHLALGSSYKECLGKNKSAIHWDMIKDMKKGEIYFDRELVFKNGKWLIL